MQRNRSAFLWLDLTIKTTAIADRAVVDLRMVYRETGHVYSELEPILIRTGERFWFPLNLCDGMEEYWGIIVSKHDIDPVDWVEGFERTSKGIYRCTEIDRMNTELLESYPFRG